MTVTVAGIDCGTNSIRLMVARISSDGSMEVVVPRIMRVVRLGQDVDKIHRFSPEALKRTFAAIDEFAQVLSAHKPDALRFVATSATRDAENRDDFDRYVFNRLGVHPDVIPGQEEARLSFLGATSVVDASLHRPPYLVMDLGGGSTELVLGGDGRSLSSHQVAQSYSMDMGSVRVSERHLLSDPPTDNQIQEASADIDRSLDLACAAVDLSQTGTFIGVSGTVTTMAGVALGLKEYNRQAIDGVTFSLDDIFRVDQKVLFMTRQERGQLGVIHPGRLDVIGGGALILTQVLARTRRCLAAGGEQLTSLTVSEHGLLDGIVRDLGMKLLTSCHNSEGASST